MRNVHLPIIFGLVAHCASSNQARDGRADIDVVVDSSDEFRVDAGDASDAAPLDGSDAEVDAEAARDSTVDSSSDIEVLDAGGDAQATDACEPDGPSCSRPSVNGSCGEGAAPSAHCREVYFEGTPFVMGETSAQMAKVDGSRSIYPIRACDLHTTTPHSGYIDAYEVTVARFRTWMRAGMPQPRVGDVLFNGWTWRTSEIPMPVGPPNSNEYTPGVTPTESQCTYSDTPGVHDDLPVNCVSLFAAQAFCWWDGKHIVTEAAWEYVARNRGTTSTPWGGAPVADERACMFGDVGTFSGYCPTEPRPRPIGSYPMGVSRDPAGVFDLFGGVQEYVFGFEVPYNRMDLNDPCRSRLPPNFYSDARTPVRVLTRGAAWNQGLAHFEAFSRAATRGGLPEPPVPMLPWSIRSPRVGIRCARWVPEPRSP